MIVVWWRKKMKTEVETISGFRTSDGEVHGDFDSAELTQAMIDIEDWVASRSDNGLREGCLVYAEEIIEDAGELYAMLQRLRNAQMTVDVNKLEEAKVADVIGD